ncbi:MAG: hypothetical protein ACRD07_10560 [Acidimicrobiales bacterium]
MHVESRITGERDAADAGGDALGRHTTGRVVREPGRWPRVAAIIAALGLMAGAAALQVLGTGEPPRPEDDAEDAGVAYLEAVRRLGHAGSFAYRGSVHAAGPSALRPGPSIATDVTVEGAVRLPQSITRDVAVDDRGGAVETVTSGGTVRSRTAPSIEGLAGAAWGVAGPSRGRDGGYPGRLGAALVADVLRSAGDRHRDGTDASGRAVLRATVPADDRDERYGDTLDGADVRVTLDESGDIAHVVLTSAQPEPRLVLRLDIVRLGDPGVITPRDVGAPTRRTVDVEDLVAVGVEPLELGRLPMGWALTDARVSTGQSVMWPTPVGAAGCTRLSLDYRDLRAVAEGSLHLTTASQACMAVPGRADPDAGDRTLRIGPFEGTVDERWDRTLGDVSDGTTHLSFSSDLPADALATLLASLRPFDPVGGPAAA